MKKYLSILIFGLSIATIQAQDVADAVRLAQFNPNGTARYSAMGGAFGALGGDLSAIGINPASSVIFANNQASISLSNYSNSNDSNYFGKNSSASKNTFDINQAGGVFLFENASTKDDWNKFALAINYDSDNLSNKTFSAGTNPTNSIDKYFLYYANANAYQGGIKLGSLGISNYDYSNFADQQAILGYNAYIIEPTDPTNNANTTYYTNVSYAGGGNFFQKNTVTEKGYNSKVSLNMAGQYQNWFSLGINLNFNSVDYHQSKQFIESNSNAKFASGSTVNYINFNNELYTYGSGFSIQLGAIAKATKELRFGLTYQSPTWYHLNDEFTQQLYTEGYGLSNTPNPAVFNTITTDPKVINIYDPYTLQTPSKLTASMGLVIAKRAIISVDYGVKDYSKSKFGPENQFNNPVSNNTNNDIKSVLTVANEFKIGSEVKLKQWSIRGGYQFYASPYKNKDLMSDLNVYSGGLGYSWGGTKLDLSYSTSSRESQQSFFNQGLTDKAKITSYSNIITATLVFEF